MTTARRGRAEAPGVRPPDALLARLFEQSPTALVVLDAEGRSAVANPAADALLGAAARSLDVLGPTAREAIRRGLLGESFRGPCPQDITAGGAGLEDIELSVFPIRDGGNDIRHIALCFSRVTPAVENAAGGAGAREHVAHALRTPLNGILGFAQLLHDGKVDPASPRYREFLGDILASGRELQRLINERLGAGEVGSDDTEK